MTTDFAIRAIKLYLDASDPIEFPNLPAIDKYITLGDTIKSYPAIQIVDTGSTEHDLLRGVFDTLNLEVSLHTIAADVTAEEHAELADQLYNRLADAPSITEYADNYTNLKVFDIWGFEPVSEVGDDRNITTFNLSMVCCQEPLTNPKPTLNRWDDSETWDDSEAWEETTI